MIILYDKNLLKDKQNKVKNSNNYSSIAILKCIRSILFASLLVVPILFSLQYYETYNFSIPNIYFPWWLSILSMLWSIMFLLPIISSFINKGAEKMSKKSWILLIIAAIFLKKRRKKDAK